MEIKVNINPLKAARELPYLGRKIMYNNSDLLVLYSNLWKSYIILGMVEMVLGKMGAPIKVWSMMYKALFQVVLLYGRKSG